ncbi:SDR family NAD(P)-dependent oxidoreductase [Actinomadura scrupuli]|uniref:SDR family NAD(P)-dependent oxidoreductase n=1 Tax=Actinomadura scrupuli TaxID=559629 RepID=UPI003D99319F
MTDLKGTTALVTGAGRGFGRAAATALTGAGAEVVGVARDRAALEDLRAELGDAFVLVAADATDPGLANRLLAAHRPRTLVLNAGARPVSRPLHHHTWETFSRNWETDVRHVFHWVRAAMLLPLAPGSTVIAVSSAAALGGSPLSGGYAGAKAAVRFVAAYAATESERDGSGLRFTAVLPSLTPATELGAEAVAAYAGREGVPVETFLGRLGPILTPEQVAAAVLDLATTAAPRAAYRITAAGLVPLD